MSTSAPDLQAFLDSLGTLGTFLSLALEQLQDAGDKFVLNANEKQFGAFEGVLLAKCGLVRSVWRGSSTE